MQEDERQRLGASFGAAAAAYAEHRPVYAPDAVRWALAPAPGRRVLDLGAGTGKLTATLVSLGVDVIAVEPDAAMLGELRARLPGVRALRGRAEGIPLPDGAVGAVLAGHALHWFDMDLAGPEIARVLAPGGILAGLWNVLDDRVEWVAGLARVSGSAVVGPRDTLSEWRAATAGLHLPGPGVAARFASPAGRVPARAAPHRRFPDGHPRHESGGARDAGRGSGAHARARPRVPGEQAGDGPGRVHRPDADRRAARATPVNRPSGSA